MAGARTAGEDLVTRPPGAASFPLARPPKPATVEAMAVLFSPLRQRGVTLRNRFVVSPLRQSSCGDGFATDWHLVHLGSRAVGGAGVVIAEPAAVEAPGSDHAGPETLWTPST